MPGIIQTNKEELQKRGYKGFTLMEMLIVVAIIAVLVAIAIPIFSGQLEKAREATDAANIRAAYANVSAKYLANGNATSEVVNLVQTTSGWSSDINIGNVTPTGTPQAGGNANVSVDANGNVTIAFSSAANAG